jgi:hypothetical protein
MSRAIAWGDPGSEKMIVCSNSGQNPERRWEELKAEAPLANGSFKTEQNEQVDRTISVQPEDRKAGGYGQATPQKEVPPLRQDSRHRYPCKATGRRKPLLAAKPHPANPPQKCLKDYIISRKFQ